MRYADGEDVLLGDIVGLGGTATGQVVAVIDEGVYRADYPAEEWGYLREGVLLLSDTFGLLHQPTPEGDFFLIRRQ